MGKRELLLLCPHSPWEMDLGCGFGKWICFHQEPSRSLGTGISFSCCFFHVFLFPVAESLEIEGFFHGNEGDEHLGHSWDPQSFSFSLPQGPSSSKPRSPCPIPVFPPWINSLFHSQHSQPLQHPQSLEYSRIKTGRGFPGIGTGSDPTGTTLSWNPMGAALGVSQFFVTPFPTLEFPGISAPSLPPFPQGGAVHPEMESWKWEGPGGAFVPERNSQFFSEIPSFPAKILVFQ